MEAIQKLENLGYRLEAAAGNIKFEYTGPGQLDKAQAKPLLEALKANKQEALAYLQTRKERAALVQDMFNELNKLLDGQDGHYSPGLEKRITQSQQRLDELWYGDIQAFQAELRKYYALAEQDIQHSKNREGGRK